MVYVSITGLRLKASRHGLRFWWHAIRSMAQAQRAAGNLMAETRTINGVHHTLSVWTDESTMRAFLISGAHRKAMKAFRTIATGRTLGFTAVAAPDWSAVHDLWLTKGRDV